jgi:predicted PurR-regulated permease PerM
VQKVSVARPLVMHVSPKSPGLGKEIFGVLGGYIVGQIKVSLILGVLYSIGYALIGVPFWFVIGPLSGAVNIIPVLGSFLGFALAGLALLFADAPAYKYLWLLVVFVVVQGLEGFYLTPKLLGRRVGLSAWSTFLAIFIGSMAFGPIGMLVSVPLLAVVAVVWRRWNANPAKHSA